MKKTWNNSIMLPFLFEPAMLFSIIIFSKMLIKK
jgi:hypothetical protein